MRVIWEINLVFPSILGTACFWPWTWITVDVLEVVVDCPVEAPAWLMGIFGFLGSLSCGMPRAL